MLSCPIRNTYCGGQVRKIAREDGKLTVRSVKLFAGGGLTKGEDSHTQDCG
jgi:hypothetical protein